MARPAHPCWSGPEPRSGGGRESNPPASSRRHTGFEDRGTPAFLPSASPDSLLPPSFGGGRSSGKVHPERRNGERADLNREAEHDPPASGPWGDSGRRAFA